MHEHREKMAKEGNAEKPVFCTKNGTYIGKSNLTRQVFRPALKAAGLPEVRFHDLRHSHASALLRDGASIKAVSQRLGHSTVELTLRVYYTCCRTRTRTSPGGEAVRLTRLPGDWFRIGAPVST